jgi:hypothetical protein
MVYPPGSAIQFTSVEYSDFTCLACVITLKTTNLPELAARYAAQVRAQGEHLKIDGFPAFLITEGYAMAADVTTVHLGSYIGSKANLGSTPMTNADITALAERLGATVSCLKYISNRYDFGDDTELFECGVYDMDDAATALRALLSEREGLRGALTDTSASLAAAISLLERSPKTAAPSDRMFDQMLQDYRASLGRARAQQEIKTDD